MAAPDAPAAPDAQHAYLLCASRARYEFRLTERDLRDLPCRLTHNRRRSDGPPTRLYERAALLEAAAAKLERERHAAEHAAETAAARRAERRRTAAVEARDRAARLAAAPSRVADAVDTLLPPDLWRDILGRLVRGACPLLWGPSALAHALASAACTCRELRAAVSRDGWPALAARLTFEDHLASDEELRALGDCLASPARPLDAWRRACRALRLRVSGNKAQLQLRVLDGLRLAGPSGVPAAVLLSVRAEAQLPMPWHACMARPPVWDALRDLPDLPDPGTAAGTPGRKAARALLRERYGDLAGVLAAVERESAARREAVERDHAAELERRRASLAAVAAANERLGLCACGNARAAACVALACGRCCAVPVCARHRPRA
jgi:hypothetical protein